MAIRKRGNRVWQVTIELGKNSEGKRIRKTQTIHGAKVDAYRAEQEMKAIYSTKDKLLQRRQ